jgi:hypothetical protein
VLLLRTVRAVTVSGLAWSTVGSSSVGVQAIWLIRAYVRFAQMMPVRSCAVAAAVSSVDKGRATKRDKLPSLYRTAAVLPLPRAGNGPTATPRRSAPPEGPRFFRAASHRLASVKTTPRTVANLAAMSRAGKSRRSA